MASIRKTKKIISKNVLTKIWLEHAKFWTLHCSDLKNEYRQISSFLMYVDIAQISKLTGISKEKIRKYICCVL